MKPLDLESLRSAVTGSAAAFRARTRLQPAGGEGDKVFPPTIYSNDCEARKIVMQFVPVNPLFSDENPPRSPERGPIEARALAIRLS